MLRLLVVIFLVLTVLFPSNLFAEEGRVIYLVRHAEKAKDGTKNPHLTEVGKKRASYIAALLQNEEIRYIFSTNYYRTQETAKPLATKLIREVQIYNPSALKDFAKKLTALKGNILVVGHSNTTPQLVTFLGGDSHGQIDESDYSRLYKLVFADGKINTELKLIQLEDFN